LHNTCLKTTAAGPETSCTPRGQKAKKSLKMLTGMTRNSGNNNKDHEGNNTIHEKKFVEKASFKSDRRSVHHILSMQISLNVSCSLLYYKW